MDVMQDAQFTTPKRSFRIFRMVRVLTALLGNHEKSPKIPGFDNPAAIVRDPDATN